MSKYDHILNISSPKDIKDKTIEQLNVICTEIRQYILDVVSKNGGHLSSNLGAVEAIVALHYVFDCPHDKLIFDVSHQAYTHKILTGRCKEFVNLRKLNGISGFTSYNESIYDVYEAGHSSTSIASMCGFLKAKKLGENIGEVISFIGDASIQNGLALCALNYLSSYKDEKGIIILNDNEMSISKSYGGLANMFNKIRIKKSYTLVKKAFPKIFRNAIKTVVYRKSSFFKELGFKYIGPIDGHNLKELITYFNYAKNCKESIILHIKTKKGNGYKYALEDKIGKYHGVNSFDLEKGLTCNNKTFSMMTSEILDEMFEKYPKLYAICPSMTYGMGLSEFSCKYKDRYSDTGINEEMSVVLASSLALSGYVPICLTYSTFYQRAYDQINHDCVRPNLHVIFIADRAGIVSCDGSTHQGIFDISMLLPLDIVIVEGSNYDEMKFLLEFAINENRPVYLRYSKADACYVKRNITLNNYKWVAYNEMKDIVILSYGSFINTLYDNFKDDAHIINCLFINPIDKEMINKLDNKKVIIYEEVIGRNCLATMIKEYIFDNNLNIKVYTFNIKDYKVCAKSDEIRNINNMSINDIRKLIDTLKR